jgi:hypothetical protein
MAVHKRGWIGGALEEACSTSSDCKCCPLFLMNISLAYSHTSVSFTLHMNVYACFI